MFQYVHASYIALSGGRNWSDVE